MKTILVTGAGRGLGMCLLRAHRQRGDRVFAVDIDMTPELVQLAKEDSAVIAIQGDIGSTPSVEGFMERIAAQTDHLDILYNNAAIYYPDMDAAKARELPDYDLDDIPELVNVNAVGPLRVAKAAMKHALLRPGATVCNTSSEAGSITDTDVVRTAEYGYCMSKAALNKGATILYNDLIRKGVRVICMQPGWMRTRMGGKDALTAPNSVDPKDTAAGFLRFTDDFDSTDIDHLFFRATGEPMGW